MNYVIWKFSCIFQMNNIFMKPSSPVWKERRFSEKHSCICIFYLKEMLPFSKRTTTSIEGIIKRYGRQNALTCSKGKLCTSQGLALHFLKGIHRSKHNPIIWAWRNRAKLNFLSDIHWLNDIEPLIALFSIGAIWWLEKATVHIAYRLGHTCQKMLKT